ncbi:conjugal transfer protein TraF [Vibrio antiquarius]|uniref:Conjugal transfer protein TraF n=1 Tax=Vibrio parahaemolyticus TaxID=670 RepID=A0A8H9TM88_VIBPH|nr:MULTISPECIES: conjugal transfer protein TraF [Vibrio harveyi group]EJG0181975.1 conjugal transfer protein TraF [Vibrio parahaemolyticus]MCS0311748.1 conjugal transfer protein TraF [Vibrio diabolicus]UYV30206.1 conjugal transfer protein TraF [Vibrio parahaemolyticus]UYW19786.1 conjugal transfer protein TraF [Vibrio parahaemolyticus]
MKKVLLTLAVSAAFSSQAFSATAFDARSVGMGGIGVSTSNYLMAPFHNPALVAKYGDSDDVGILLPSIGVNLQDKGEMVDGIDSAVDAIDALEANRTQQNASNVVDALAALNRDSAYVQAGLGMAVAIPNQFVSVNLFTQGYADAFVYADVADSDLNESDLLNPSHTYDSTATVAGISVVEFGAALAKDFKLENSVIYYGLTPKIQQVKTINYVSDINNFEFDDMTDDQYQNSETSFNLDAGIAYTMNNGLSLGLVGRNLISQSYDTVELDGVKASYSINPVFVASASYNHSWFTIGADIDLNETERFEDMSGFMNSIDSSSDNTQLAGIGIELNAWDWAQLRAGYQTDIANNLDDQFTAGIGISPFGTVRIDLAGSYAGENQLGASLQTSMTF